MISRIITLMIVNNDPFSLVLRGLLVICAGRCCLSTWRELWSPALRHDSSLSSCGGRLAALVDNVAEIIIVSDAPTSGTRHGNAVRRT